ncbi:MAG: hypothetical protein GY795_39980 [Desulfobacterales bacterium]|nr:hypothetical protein [Desulfobacterales bacterium]
MKTVFQPARIAIIFITVLILCGQTCQAQHEDMGGIEFGTAYIGPANVKGKNGEVGGYSASVATSLANLNFGYQYLSFGWDQVNDLPFGNGKDDPWEHLHSASVGYEYSKMADKRWGYFAGINVISQFEKEISGSFGATGFAGMIFNIPESNLIFQTGGVLSYNEVEITVMPLVGLEWNPGAKSGFSATLGVPATQVSYHYGPTAYVSLGLTMDGGMYRLSDDSTVEKEGYLEMESYSALLALGIELVENCDIQVGGLYFFNRDLTLYNKDGDNGRTYGLDEALGMFLNVSLAF